MKKGLERLRLYLKKVFGRVRNETIRTNFLQAIPFWIGSLITGLVAVLYTRLFGFAETGASFVFKHYSWALFILTPVCFVIARWLVVKFAPYARGSGIPQVIASIELANPKQNSLVDKLLSLRIIFIKIFSSLIMVLGGGVIGREGPTIQIAGSIFWEVNGLLPAWWPKISKRNMIMTGAAAGLAAAFNTPLGGIVFAVEELTKTHIKYFKTAIFTAVIIAGLTAQAFLGPYLYLGYPDVNNLSPYIFFAVALVAVSTGIAGSAMSKLMLVIFRWKSKMKLARYSIAYLIVSALIIASFGYFFHQISVGSGKELMTKALFTGDKYNAWYMPIVRILGSVLSFTSGAAGGVFAPALASGASIGSWFAGLFHLTSANSNILILAGMVGFLTGVTRTPFTSAILVLEMTDRHNVIFHLMLAGMISSLAAMVIDKHSFYDHLKLMYIRELSRHQDEEKEEEKTAEPAI
ncbi:MAG: chloride channel protein [Bacteroidetes bacterium]|nr:MAG: chloride channel protein [Bacteroidota bacterium]